MRRPTPHEPARAPTGLTVLIPVLLSFLAFVAGHVSAEPSLIVNGYDVAGNTTTLVKGSSYAPGSALAQALGAAFFVDPQRTVATLTLAGRTLEVPIAAGPAQTAEGGIRLDGNAVSGGAAVLSGAEIFLPVKPVAAAFGGSVAYLDASDSVIVTLPRARLTRLERQVSGSQERLLVRLSAPVRYSMYYNEPVNRLEFHIERTDVAAAVTPAEGTSFVRAATTASGGSVDLRVQLQPGVAYQVYELVEGKGFDLVIAFLANGPVQPAGPAARVVLDPGHGGEDQGLDFPGQGSEAALTLGLAQRLMVALQARGLDVSLTRTGDFSVPAVTRSRDAVAADMFVSIHAAALPPGQFHVYYLADADSVDELDMAIRTNAAAALRSDDTDTLRRKVLLNLVPDLDQGRRFAEGLGAHLFEAGNYRASETAGAPIFVLGGAAGRGVLFEFGPADLASKTLPEALAAAIAVVLTSTTP